MSYPPGANFQATQHINGPSEMIIILCNINCSYVVTSCTKGEDKGVSRQTGLDIGMMHIHMHLSTYDRCVF